MDRSVLLEAAESLGQTHSLVQHRRHLGKSHLLEPLGERWTNLARDNSGGGERLPGTVTGEDGDGAYGAAVSTQGVEMHSAFATRGCALVVRGDVAEGGTHRLVLEPLLSCLGTSNLALVSGLIGDVGGGAVSPAVIDPVDVGVVAEIFARTFGEVVRRRLQPARD